MLMTVVLFVIGLLLIMFGGDRFVDAAVDLHGMTDVFK